MNILFKRIFCIFTACVLTVMLLSGCKDKAQVSSEVSTSSEIIESQSKADDSADPENADIISESGAGVKAEELQIKEGKANGIDVSKWQGKINWSAVKKSGIDFAVIRIGFRGENGIIYKDDCADYNIQQAEKAGVLVGVYFFSTAVNTSEAEEEAKWTAAAIAGYPISYPVVYDCEGFKSTESRMYGISNAQRTDNAAAFLRYIEKQGYEGMLYSAKSELENSACWDTKRLESSYKIWVARYPDIPYPKTAHPDYSGKYDMWQYTDKGIVKGISGNTDMVVSYFTREKASPKNSKLRPQAASAPDTNADVYTAVSDEVTAKIEVNLRDAATTKGNVVAAVKNGAVLKRTGIGTNGWSRIIYNGKTVYAVSSYLTTDLSYAPTVSDGFTAADGKLTAKDETNLRAEPNTSSEIIATIKNGEFLTRTGVNPNGWTRLSYNGRTVYAKTSLLTDKVIKEPEVSSEAPVSDGFTPASGKVTAKDETRLRTSPSTDNSEVVYLLKKGEFVERTGKNDKGWTKISYNGQTVYAVSSLLLTEAEYKAQTESSVEAEGTAE